MSFVYRLPVYQSPLSLHIVTLMWIGTLRPLTAGLHQAILPTGHVFIDRDQHWYRPLT